MRYALCNLQTFRQIVLRLLQILQMSWATRVFLPAPHLSVLGPLSYSKITKAAISMMIGLHVGLALAKSQDRWDYAKRRAPEALWHPSSLVEDDSLLFSSRFLPSSQRRISVRSLGNWVGW